MDQDALVALFDEMSQEYHPSTLRVIYSCIDVLTASTASKKCEPEEHESSKETHEV